MNECLTTPQHKTKSAIACQTNGIYIKSKKKKKKMCIIETLKPVPRCEPSTYQPGSGDIATALSGPVTDVIYHCYASNACLLYPSALVPGTDVGSGDVFVTCPGFNKRHHRGHRTKSTRAKNHRRACEFRIIGNKEGANCCFI